MSVIKLGGCNGSGKSTLARAILDLTAEGEPREYVLPSGKKTKYYSGSWHDVPVLVLGKYETACGGMDTISDKDDRYSMVVNLTEGRYGKRNIVFFEGLITGKTYGALGQLSELHVKSRIPWLYAFMGTSWEECVARVLKRRQAAGNLEPFDPERTMRSTFNSLQKLEQKLKNGTLPPHPTHRIAHTLKPATAAKQLLNKALEVHNAR